MPGARVAARSAAGSAAAIVSGMTSLRRALLVLLVLVLAVLTGGAASPAAAGSSPLRAGLGYRLAGGDFVGFYLARSNAAPSIDQIMSALENAVASK